MIKRFFRRLWRYAGELWWDTKEDILIWRQRKLPKPELKAIPFPELAKMLEEAWAQPILASLTEPCIFARELEKEERA